jgi:hypothetical protein
LYPTKKERTKMDKKYFTEWLEKKVKETLEFEAKDEVNKAFILGAATVMNEILKQVNESKFDINK